MGDPIDSSSSIQGTLGSDRRELFDKCIDLKFKKRNTTSVKLEEKD
jgi:hypothetical protein